MFLRYAQHYYAWISIKTLTGEKILKFTMKNFFLYHRNIPVNLVSLKLLSEMILFMALDFPYILSVSHRNDSFYGTWFSLHSMSFLEKWLFVWQLIFLPFFQFLSETILCMTLDFPYILWASSRNDSLYGTWFSLHFFSFSQKWFFVWHLIFLTFFQFLSEMILCMALDFLYIFELPQEMILYMALDFPYILWAFLRNDSLYGTWFSIHSLSFSQKWFFVWRLIFLTFFLVFCYKWYSWFSFEWYMIFLTF